MGKVLQFRHPSTAPQPAQPDLLFNGSYRSSLPKGKTLFAHQESGVLRLTEGFGKRKGILLGDDQGLGKTIQTIVARNILDHPRMLIVCPASVRGVWRQEVEEWSTAKEKIHVCYGRSDGLDSTATVTIVSYELAISKWFLSALQEWPLLVVDESHTLSRAGTKRARVVKHLHDRADKVFFLSGSINRNKVDQLYPVFHILEPQEFPTYDRFIREYCYVEEDGRRGLKVLGGRNLPKLNQIAKSRFLIRRKKEKVLASLPDKIEQKIPLHLPSQTVSRLEEAAAAFSEESLIDQINDEREDENLTNLRLRLAKEKTGLVVEYSKDLLEGGAECLVIFCYYLETFDRIIQGLRTDCSIHGRNITANGICSLTPGAERERLVKQFQGGELDVMVLTTAGCEGITLTRASTIVMAELSFSRSQNDQVVDRLHRIGQKQTVHVKHLIASDTIEETIYRGYKRKVAEHRRVLG